MSKFQLHPVRASAIILILFSLGFSIYSFANAWVEPSATPPGGNIAAPLHTGTTSQIKQGSLSISGAGGYGIYAQGASYGVYGVNTSNGAYGLLGYAGYGGYFHGPVYTDSYSQAAGNIVNSAPSQGWIGLTGDLPGYSANVYPTLKTNGSYLYFSTAGKYEGYMGSGVFRLYDENSRADLQLGSLWGYTGLLAGNGGSPMYFGSDQYFQFLNRSGGYGPPVYAQDFYSNAAGMWMSQMGGNFLRKDVNDYLRSGVRIGFNGSGITTGSAYGIGNGAAYYNPGSIAVDTVETDGGYGGGGTLELNYYGGNAVTIGPGGTKPLYAAIIYDGNNTGYYLDPNYYSNVYGMQPVYSFNGPVYDWNNGGYYIDPNGTSRFNYTVNDNVYSYGWMQAPIYYDQQNNGYYVDPNGSSRMNQLYYVDSAYIVDLRPQYMYDWNDGNYYMDFNNTSRVNYLGRNYGWNWTEYDWNDTTYYMDLNNVSILNDLRVNILYDRQNTGYYVDPASTSRMNYGVFDNIYSYSWIQAPIFYDANNTGYYVDPASTTVLNVVYANQYNCMSDINLKKDIKPINDALNKVLSIKGVSFTWKDEEMGTGNQVGVIAQDVEKVLPEVVTTNEQGLKAVDYSKLTPLIIESIKDLKIEKDQDVEILREKIDNLEANERVREEIINDLKRRIEALESK
ncbi:MAG: tail fiber domain-containing protein [Candidatus Moranbacteria bacterium]|nr:tail fiber domain-containing protein [Candidatus Moranbacteria bacterium]